LLRAGETDTLTTRVFDVAFGYNWLCRFPSRVLRNNFFELWSGWKNALASDADAHSGLVEAVAADDRNIAQVDAGQGIGLLTEACPVNDVVKRLPVGAAELLGSWAFLTEAVTT
jgi:nitronate monooxygenase